MVELVSRPLSNLAENDLLEIIGDAFKRLNIRIEDRKNRALVGTRSPSLFSWGERVHAMVESTPSGPRILVVASPIVPTNVTGYASANRLARALVETVEELARLRLA